MYQTTDITIIIAHKPINRSCFKSAAVSFGRGTPSHVLPCVFNIHPAMILSTLWIDVLFPSYIHQLSKLLLVHFRKEVFQCIYKHICIKQFFYLFSVHPCNLHHFICSCICISSTIRAIAIPLLSTSAYNLLGKCKHAKRYILSIICIEQYLF